MSEETVLNCKDIAKLIPHRYPFLLVDKIVDIVPNKMCVGIKNFTSNEEFFQGHFPGEPIAPGVLLLEAMAQTAAALTVKSLGLNPASTGVLFASIDNAKFKRPVLPGDVFKMKIKILKEKMKFYTVEGKGFVDDCEVVEAIFTALIYDKSRKKI
ncbi:MAG: 3-hydroxyacyl-ACP dehydratase FabZ [Rickettsiales bacterium]|jgi:3-hydroxyacyl-[acyl-carrier-protein] dehydratase|nr:3-hydroxyacyl-ACP dehydratase FabZ [Rickettsiales bacterium]